METDNFDDLSQNLKERIDTFDSTSTEQFAAIEKELKQLKKGFKQNVHKKEKEIDPMQQATIAAELQKIEDTKDFILGIDYFLKLDKKGEIVPEIDPEYLEPLVTALRMLIDSDDFIDVIGRRRIETDKIDTLYSAISGLKGLVDAIYEKFNRLHKKFESLDYALYKIQMS